MNIDKRISYFCINIVDGYKSKKTKKENTLTHILSNFQKNLDYENFIDSSINISFQKVNSDTYLKVFDTNIVNTDLKPDNFDTLTSEIDLNLESEKFTLNTGFTAYENLSKQNSDRYQYVLPYYDFHIYNNNLASFNFFSQGDNILKDTNSLRSRMINNLNIQSFDFFSKNELKNNFNYYLKNTITAGKNNVEYDSSPHVKFMNIFEVSSSYPLVNINEDFVDYLNPKLSLRINPSDMKGYKNEKRQINTENIFNINRLGLIDTLEPGQNLTMGLDYKKERIDNINEYFELKLGKVIRTKQNNNIPSNSTLDKNQLFCKFTNNLNNNINFNYEFSINHDLDKINMAHLELQFQKQFYDNI